MDKRTLKISTLDPDNKSKPITVTNINTSPSITSAQILNFSKDLVRLTDNSYISTTESTETKLD